MYSITVAPKITFSSNAEFLGDLSDTSMLCFVLRSLEKNAIPFLPALYKIAHKFIKVPEPCTEHCTLAGESHFSREHFCSGFAEFVGCDSRAARVQSGFLAHSSDGAVLACRQLREVFQGGYQIILQNVGHSLRRNIVCGYYCLSGDLPDLCAKREIRHGCLAARFVVSRFLNFELTIDIIAGITLRGNCVVELYGLDLTTAYQVRFLPTSFLETKSLLFRQHAFVYIRQVALHLRR